MTEPDYPYPQATLAALRPGDTLVVTKRAFGSPVNAFGGDSLVFSNLKVYGSSNWAFVLDSISNSVVDRVSVMPRPGVALIGSNGDGIHLLSLAAEQPRPQQLHLLVLLDDGIVIDAVWMGTGPRTVRGAPGARAAA